MKKKLLYIAGISGIIAAAFCAFCIAGIKNNSETGTSSVIEGTADAQNCWQADTHHVAAGNGGYYYMQFNTSGKLLLYYSEPETQREIPLCGLPECGHDTKECNAYLEAEEYQYGTVYYNRGSLYVIHKKQGMSYLCKINSDGSGREDICGLFPADGYCSVTLVFHGDDIYAYNSTGHSGSTEIHTEEIKKISADGNVTTVYEYSGTGAAITSARAYDDYLYFIILEYKMNLTEKTHSADQHLYRYCYEDNTVDKVLEKQVSGYCAAGSCLIYFETGTGVFVYDLQLQKEELRIKADENMLVANMSYDGEYLYLDNAGMGSLTDAFKRVDRVVRIYDGNFEKAGEINCTKECTGVYFGDEKYFFIRKNDYIYYEDKRQLLQTY